MTLSRTPPPPKDSEQSKMIKATPQEYIAARSKGVDPTLLTQFTKKELASFDITIIKGKDAGYAITPEEELVGLFNYSDIKGLGKELVIDAIAKGARTLNCFSGFLPKYYAQFGFVEIDRIKWDDQYAPKDWDYMTKGKPDIIYMEYVGLPVTSLSFMKNKYQIIYADPPWKYNSRVNHKTRFRGGACGHYDLMTMDEIKKLPIPELAADNCALFMWCTFPYLNKQIELFDYWGLRYRTVGFTWVKTNPINGKPFFGVGYYAKSNAEVCLLGIKGRLKPVSNKVSSIIIAPRRKHSQKPDEARERIVELFGNLSRIVLFAREKIPGWDVWGNEVESDIELL